MSRIRWSIVLLVTAGLGAWGTLQAVGQRAQPVLDLIPPQNFNEIEPGLYLGGLVESPPKGTECVLNLCQYEDPYKLKYHYWNAIPDAEPGPNLEWLAKQVEIVDHHRKKGRTVYVHCLAGISRSGMVTAAYLMQKHGWSRDQTIEFMRKARPIVNPNPAFMDLLTAWEKRK